MPSFVLPNQPMSTLPVAGPSLRNNVPSGGSGPSKESDLHFIFLFVLWLEVTALAADTQLRTARAVGRFAFRRPF